MKTRLLHVVPPWNFQGSEQPFLTLATRLDRDRFQPCVLLIGKQIRLATQLLDAGVEIFHDDQPVRLHLSHIRRIKSLIEETRPDLIHVWNAPQFATHWLAALQQRVPVIASETPAGLPQTTIQRLAKFGLLRRSHGFVVMSPAAGHVRDDHFDVIPMGIDSAAAELPTGTTGDEKEEDTVTRENDSKNPTGDMDGIAFRNRIETLVGARIAVAINPLVPATGLKDAIWSTDLIKCVRDDFHLLILGAGPQRWRLDRFIQQTRTNDRIHFVKGISATELLAHADLLWQTSRTETDPSIVLLAMASGVPVVATDLASHRQLVVDGETGYLIAPGGRADLARRTQLILDDESLQKHMQAASRERAKNRFPSQTMIDRYQRLCNSCLQT